MVTPNSQTLLPIAFSALGWRGCKDSPLAYSFAIPWPAHREEYFLHWCISCRLPPWDDHQATKPAYWLCDDFYSMQTSQSTGFARSRTSLSFVIGYHFFLLGTSLSYHSIINNSMFFLKIAGRKARCKRIISEANKRGFGILPTRKNLRSGNLPESEILRECGHTPYACSSVTTSERKGGRGREPM